MNDVEDDLLDLWNVRYVVEYRGLVSRVEAQGILFDPGRPLVDATARGPLGHEAFRVAPTPTDRLRLLGALDGGADLATGETVAVLTVEGGGVPPETLLVRAGHETAEGRPGEAAHARPAVGHVWRAMDADKRVHHRDVFVADLPLAAPRLVERVVVRVVARTGTFRLQGLGLVDGGSGKVDSVLASHREKYAVAYQNDRATIYENRDVLPRAFVVPRARIIPPEEWAIVNLTDGTVDPLREVLIERARVTGRGAPDHEATYEQAPEAPGSMSPGPGARVREDATVALQPAAIEIDEPDRVVVRASAPAGGYLVLSDAYDPGWRAVVDGRDASVERANTVMRAVALPPGDHVVELRFEPPSFVRGMAASAIAWAAIGGLAFAGFRRPSGRSATQARQPAFDPPGREGPIPVPATAGLVGRPSRPPL
ncbi:MAG: YfhO family protein [Chloroflexota bacterium]|nr:YfhO family protein [Chloroflexota bacterium]